MAALKLVGGLYGGRKLAAPPNGTRPTAQRTREALFNMLEHAPWSPWATGDGLEGAIVLDGFAGTGALGIEALSRGADHATFMDQAPAAFSALKANSHALDLGERARLLRIDATRPPRCTTKPATLVLLDPPYLKGLVPRALKGLARQGWLAPGALIVAETENLPPTPVPASDSVPGAERPPLKRDKNGRLIVPPPPALPSGITPLLQRAFGAALLTIWRHDPLPPPEASAGQT
ncbi:RsmD family RNA methyltransferase [Formicincola oecophyllae]|uniref:RsmD family RNA methyltransferase n=1 Tax=Formicincola oecophyllae TaxID=2558361 RepID=A0A4Y6U8E5_9PROT|nr:RsmD family RNA methyltransferase [Formicincola oecophyllae]QDH13250.1 RsmD family RNA methyltransferase [Formicincola oecophyllae]